MVIGWLEVFLGTVTKAAPASALPEDLTEREANHWWKAKKWAYFNLNRLFVRYIAPLSTKSHSANLPQLW